LVHDPVHQSQLYLRRVGQFLRGKGVLPKDSDSPLTPYLASTSAAPGETLDEAALERFFDTGYKQVARLAPEIEALMGGTLESRRALDFGCGMGRTALPLAERCEHVYGVDTSPAALRDADLNAKRMNLSNVQWMEAGRLAELSGRYDLVLSMWVFQHIPSREGERIFAALLRGLRPGGVGVIHVTLRFAYSPFRLVRDLDWSMSYMLMNSYSLNRLGRLLADEGVTEWRAKWHARRTYPSATIMFRKD
jgi:2-polyprenyl-3-methyl-5-hydroxy-6-metoxy-1,4-benzoquinol methylase